MSWLISNALMIVTLIVGILPGKKQDTNIDKKETKKPASNPHRT